MHFETIKSAHGRKLGLLGNSLGTVSQLVFWYWQAKSGQLLQLNNDYQTCFLFKLPMMMMKKTVLAFLFSVYGQYIAHPRTTSTTKYGK